MTVKLAMMLIAGGAMVTDLSCGRIRNRLCAAGWMTGLFLAAGGALPAGEWMAGAALPLLIGWPLFRMRLMGAGDIKLLSVLGGLAGGGALLPLLFRIFLCGGALSVLMLLRDGGSFARRGLKCCRLPELTASGTGTIHFAVPVLMGCALWMAA